MLMQRSASMLSAPNSTAAFVNALFKLMPRPLQLALARTPARPPRTSLCARQCAFWRGRAAVLHAEADIALHAVRAEIKCPATLRAGGASGVQQRGPAGWGGRLRGGGLRGFAGALVSPPGGVLALHAAVLHRPAAAALAFCDGGFHRRRTHAHTGTPTAKKGEQEDTWTPPQLALHE